MKKNNIMKRNNATAPSPDALPAGTTVAGRSPMELLRAAGTWVVQLVLGHLPEAVPPSADPIVTAAAPRSSMKIVADEVIRCGNCRTTRAAVPELQVLLAPPLAELLASEPGQQPAAALGQELAQVCAAGQGAGAAVPAPGMCWSALVEETIALLVRFWPAVLAVARLLHVHIKDEVAPLDVLEVAVPAIIDRAGPLPFLLWQLLQLGHEEAREALAAAARAADPAGAGMDLQRLRGELWRWESLLLYVAQAEAEWGPSRETQGAALNFTVFALRARPHPHPPSRPPKLRPRSCRKSSRRRSTW